MLESEPGSPGLQVSRVALSRKFYHDTRKSLSRERKAEGHEELGWRRALQVVRKSVKRTVVAKCIAGLMAVAKADAKADDTLGIHEEVETLRTMRTKDLSNLLEDMHRPIKGIIRKSFWALESSQEKPASVEERSKAAEAEADTYSSALKGIQESMSRIDDALFSARYDADKLRRTISDLEGSFSNIGITMKHLMPHVQSTLHAVQETGGVYECLPESSESESEDSKEAVLSDSSDAEAKTDGQTKLSPLNRTAAKAVTRFRHSISQNRLSVSSDCQSAARRALSKVQSLVRATATNQFLLHLQSSNAPRLVQELETYLGSVGQERVGAQQHEDPGATKQSACTVDVCSGKTMGTSLGNVQSIQAPPEIFASPDGKNGGPLPAGVPASEGEAVRRAHSSLHKLSLDPSDDTKHKHRMHIPSKHISSQIRSEYSCGFEQRATIEPQEVAHTMGRNPALSHAIRRYHTVIVQNDGRAVAHGRNAERQCDIIEEVEDPEASDLFQTELPLAACPVFVYESDRLGESAIAAPDRDNAYTQAAAGHFHTVLLRNDGTVVARGQNAERQCNIPELVRDSTYTQVAAGDFHTVLLRSDGTVVSCGRNAERQCEIPPLRGKLMYTQVAAGRGSTVLLRSDGSAFCCGAAARSWGPVIPKQELELLGLGDGIEKLIRLMGL